MEGGNRGLFDYGPPGTALQTNIGDAWRKHFVLEENILELNCTTLPPEPVLKTSGHVDKFADWMCKDPVKGEYLRADHLVESVLESRLSRGLNGPYKDSPKLEEAGASEYHNTLAKIDNYDGPELRELIKRLDVRNPDGNGEVNPPTPFNLMFKSTIGPSAAAPVYLRPETAQGQFLNFKKLLGYNQGAMPFASASVGKAYRNEILPRSGLLRVREFLMAEIEHYAVESSIVDNETLGYFLGRVMLFLLKIGLLTSYGWIECVGCADRSAFDLTVHSAYSGSPLVVKEVLSEPVRVEEWQAVLEKKLVGPRFKSDAKAILTSVEALDQTALEQLATQLTEKSSTFVELTSDLLAISKVTRTSNTREYSPNVIEPSFGIDRILYSLLEQVYWHRPHDAARAFRSVQVFSLPLAVAPTKVLIVPLSAQPQFMPIAHKLSARLRSLGISNNIDSSSASIGKRYARNDEPGTPLGITVDFDTLADGSLTLRDRDSMNQLRGSEDEVIQAVKNPAEGIESWEEISRRLQPSQTAMRT
ncbi:glycyl-tRNA synthetase [Podospora didyma]|uniref:glycine--tRNA ligase n=1 Tax=Podospora didyma TaxID=330526 RepID=A0AAE0P7E1_9PEZI|nr:glycyl-tRNA synthetase [Podospora didyma]